MAWLCAAAVLACAPARRRTRKARSAPDISSAGTAPRQRFSPASGPNCTGAKGVRLSICLFREKPGRRFLAGDRFGDRPARAGKERPHRRWPTDQSPTSMRSAPVKPTGLEPGRRRPAARQKARVRMNFPLPAPHGTPQPESEGEPESPEPPATKKNPSIAIRRRLRKAAPRISSPFPRARLSRSVALVRHRLPIATEGRF